MKEKILITGVTGFVGSHMMDYLAKMDNVELFGIKRWHLSRQRNIKHQMQNQNHITFYDCDLTDPIGTFSMLEKIKPDKIFHFAAESFVSPSWEHPSHYMDVNYKGTVNILDAIKKLKLKTRILIPGSGEEYGEIKESELPINELTVLRPVNPYAVSKIAQDLIAYVYYKSYDLNIIRVRTFNHEGPRRDNVFGISSYAYQIARIENGLQNPIINVGHTEDKRNFTHIFDIIEAYWLAMQKCIPGELFLIGADEQDHIYTFRQALEQLIVLSGLVNVKIETDARFVRPTQVPFLIGDSRKFRNITGWRPKIGFEQILLDTLNYWRDQLKGNND